MTYKNILSNRQVSWLKKYLKKRAISLNLNYFYGIMYLLRTGCQWRAIPPQFGRWKNIYHAFRSWSERGWFKKLLKDLVHVRRFGNRRRPSPSTAVIDSQSVKSGLPRSQKGIDGGKKVKGIKRHIAAGCGGLPLEIVVTQANMHDSKAANALIARACLSYSTVQLVKADCGYRGSLVQRVKQTLGIDVDCVKSNFGTSEFIPIEGGGWLSAQFLGWTTLGVWRETTSNTFTRQRQWLAWHSWPYCCQSTN